MVASQRATGVEPRQQQEVLDEGGHPAGLLLDLRQRRVGRGPVVGPAAGQLGVPGDGRQRRPQLVRGVRDELAHLLLAAVPRLQGRPDVVEHRVQRRADLADLGAFVGQVLRYPLVQGDRAGRQRELGDRVGGRGDLAEGAELAAYDEGAGTCRGRRRPRGTAGRSVQISEPQRVVDVGGGESGGELAVTPGQRVDPVGPDPVDLELMDLAVGGDAGQVSQLSARQVAGVSRTVAEALAVRAVADDTRRMLLARGCRGLPRDQVRPRPGCDEPCADAATTLSSSWSTSCLRRARVVTAPMSNDSTATSATAVSTSREVSERKRSTGQAGFSTYPAPRRVWIIGSRPASIFLRR